MEWMCAFVGVSYAFVGWQKIYHITYHIKIMFYQYYTRVFSSNTGM